VSPLDLAFVLGALVGPIIDILSIIALAVVRPASWAMWLWITLVGVTAVLLGAMHRFAADREVLTCR